MMMDYIVWKKRKLRFKLLKILSDLIVLIMENLILRASAAFIGHGSP